MSPVLLYLRSRRVPVVAAAVLGALAASWLVFDLVGTRQIGMRTAALVIATCAACAGGSLAGSDRDLDRTAAIRWRGVRGLHVLVAAAALLVLVWLVQEVWIPLAGTDFLVPATCGLVGLAAFGAAVLGTGLGWTLPVGWSVLATAVPGAAPWLTWPTATALTWESAVPAVGAAVIGTAVYVVRGPAE